MIRIFVLLTAIFYGHALLGCAAPGHDPELTANQIRVCKPGSSVASVEDADRPLPPTWRVLEEGTCKYP